MGRSREEAHGAGAAPFNPEHHVSPKTAPVWGTPALTPPMPPAGAHVTITMLQESSPQETENQKWGWGWGLNHLAGSLAYAQVSGLFLNLPQAHLPIFRLDRFSWMLN